VTIASIMSALQFTSSSCNHDIKPFVFLNSRFSYVESPSRVSAMVDNIVTVPRSNKTMS
jgi:hypothetical protein